MTWINITVVDSAGPNTTNICTVIVNIIAFTADSGISTTTRPPGCWEFHEGRVSNCLLQPAKHVHGFFIGVCYRSWRMYTCIRYIDVRINFVMIVIFNYFTEMGITSKATLLCRICMHSLYMFATYKRICSMFAWHVCMHTYMPHTYNTRGRYSVLLSLSIPRLTWWRLSLFLPQHHASTSGSAWFPSRPPACHHQARKPRRQHHSYQPALIVNQVARTTSSTISHPVCDRCCGKEEKTNSRCRERQREREREREKEREFI